MSLPAHGRRVGRAVCAFLAASVLIIPSARADDAVAMALNRPALLTPRAQSGLVTSIARAGPRLVGVGEHGWILVSDDNGRSWRQVASPTSVTLTKIVFADAAEGWALGQMGLVLHSMNGGLTWAKQLDGIAANNMMLVAAEADVAAKGQTAVTSANLQSAEALAGGGPSVPFLNLLPLGPGHLLLVGGFGLAMESKDDGKSWTSAAAQLPNPQGLHLYGLAAAGPATYIAGEQGLLLKGPSGGPYNPVATPFAGTFFGVIATPAGGLYVYGLQGTVLGSTDAGATWHAIATGSAAGVDAGLVLRDGRLLFGDNAGDLLVGQVGATALRRVRAAEPIAALAQAADGAIIIGGPFGPRRMTLAALGTP